MDIVIRRRPISVPILPLATAVLVAILTLTSMRIGRIQANEIGVFVNNLNGELDIEVSPGAHVYNGWLTDFYKLDNTEESYRMGGEPGSRDSLNIKTRDGADVELAIRVNYRLVDDAAVIRDRVVPECGLDRIDDLDAYKLKWIRDFSRSVARYKFGELTPTEFYDSKMRTQKENECADELNRLLNPHGISVLQVVAGNYEFYDEFQEMIDQKKTAEKEVEKQLSLANAALEAQKREETKATAEKNVAVAQRDGVLLRQVLEVEAEAERELKAAAAYAYSTKTLADAEFYKAQNEAKSILALAEAEAQGMRALATSLAGEGGRNVVKLTYAEALKGAVITGVPYATDPRIQKLEVTLPDGTGGDR